MRLADSPQGVCFAQKIERSRFDFVNYPLVVKTKAINTDVVEELSRLGNLLSDKSVYPAGDDGKNEPFIF
jgi:hypothetical protein